MGNIHSFGHVPSLKQMSVREFTKAGCNLTNVDFDIWVNMQEVLCANAHDLA